MEFKFKVGDMVMTKVEATLFRGDVSLNGRRLFGSSEGLAIGVPRPMLITQRMMEECPGGVQYHYTARPWVFEDRRLQLNSTPVRFNEVELEEYDEGKWVTEITAAAVDWLAAQDVTK